MQKYHTLNYGTYPSCLTRDSYVVCISCGVMTGISHHPMTVHKIYMCLEKRVSQLAYLSFGVIVRVGFHHIYGL